MSKPQTLDEILEDILLYEPCRDYSCKGACHQVKIDQSKAALSAIVANRDKWWVTTGIKQGGKKLLGPFVSRELALSVRTYMEIAEAPATYWVEEVAL